MEFVDILKDEGQLKIASLLYWVRKLELELINYIEQHIHDNYWSKSVCNHISQILSIK